MHGDANFQNPLGFQMPDERKRELVEFAAKTDAPIENGVYNELYFGMRIRALKSYRSGSCCIARRSRRA